MASVTLSGMKNGSRLLPMGDLNPPTLDQHSSASINDNPLRHADLATTNTAAKQLLSRSVGKDLDFLFVGQGLNKGDVYKRNGTWTKLTELSSTGIILFPFDFFLFANAVSNTKSFFI